MNTNRDENKPTHRGYVRQSVHDAVVKQRDELLKLIEDRTPPPSGDGLPVSEAEALAQGLEQMMEWEWDLCKESMPEDCMGVLRMAAATIRRQAMLQSAQVWTQDDIARIEKDTDALMLRLKPIPAQVGGGDAGSLADEVDGDFTFYNDGELRQLFPRWAARIRRLAQPQREGLMSGALTEEVVRFITDTPEDVTHKALLAEGWTPPEQQPASAAVGITDTQRMDWLCERDCGIHSMGYGEYYEYSYAHPVPEHGRRGLRQLVDEALNQQADKAGVES